PIGLFGPAEPAEPGLRRDLADGFLSGLGTQRVAAGLRTGGRHADERGERVVDPAHRVEVLRQRVAGQRLDDQPGAVRVERLPDVPGRADRIAHVVQAVERGPTTTFPAAMVAPRSPTNRPRDRKSTPLTPVT